MTVASPVVAPMAAIFKTDEGLLKAGLNGLLEDELWYSPSDKTNSILWIAGHIVQTRTAVLKLLGKEFTTPWGKVFSRGSTLMDRVEYPSVEVILTVMSEASAKLDEALNSASEAFLAETPTDFGFPNCTTRADKLGFLAFHESYHVGQIGYLRKALGHGGLVG